MRRHAAGAASAAMCVDWGRQGRALPILPGRAAHDVAALYVRVARAGWVGRSSKRYLIGESVPKFRDPSSAASPGSPVAGPEPAHHESITCSSPIALSGISIFEYPARYTPASEAGTVRCSGARCRRQVSAGAPDPPQLPSPAGPGPGAARSRSGQVSGLVQLAQLQCVFGTEHGVSPGKGCMAQPSNSGSTAAPLAPLAATVPQRASIGADAAAARRYGSRVVLSSSELA